MDKVVKQTVINGFKDAVDTAISDDKREYPDNWENNPFHGVSIIMAAINETKKSYKMMMRINNTEFGIEESEVDSFVDEVSENIKKQYFL